MTSAWLGQIGLKSDLRVGTTTSLADGDSSPDWVAFLIWLGWWVSDIPITYGKMLCVCLVPTRACGTALIAFGAQIRSAQQGGSEFLSWNRFYQLSEGSEFYFLHKVPGRSTIRSYRGEIVPPDRPGEKKFHWIDENSFITIRRDRGFYRYRASLTKHPKTRRQRLLQQLAPFFELLVYDFRDVWLQSLKTECSLVSVCARWQRELAGILVEASDPAGDTKRLSLADILSPKNRRNADSGRLQLLPNEDDLKRIDDNHLVILDGPDAFGLVDSLSASRIVTLIEHNEYDASVSNELAFFSDHRIEYPSNVVSIPECKLPPWTEMILLHLASDL